MTIFVYGDDTFRVAEKVAEMKAAFLKKFDPTGLNLSVFPKEGTEEIKKEDLQQAIRSTPFLSTRRMVIIQDLVSETTKAEEGDWAEILEKTPDFTIVLLWERTEPKMLEKKALFKRLKGASDVHYYPFPSLEGAELSNWILARIKALGGLILPAALQMLMGRVGSDLWQMHGEIQKLVAFANGVSITEKMVEQLVRASFEGEIFVLIDAVSRKRPAEALKLLEQERLSGANEFYLLTMLARQVRILLGIRALLDQDSRISAQEVAAALELHPFVVGKALVQARGFTSEALKEVHHLLFQFDRNAKTSRMDAGLAVDFVTIELSK